MPVRLNDLPAVISVTEMARRVGLSRSRFYDLVKAGIFPSPVYCLRTRRPMFLTEQQADCLRVKSSNIGVNGEFVLFYAAREPDAHTGRRPRATRITTAAPTPETAELVAGLRALGMSAVTDAQVSTALRSCFEGGWAGRDDGEILRTIWQFLRRSGAA